MSGRLVSRVLESALPAWLKPYAVAFASFARDDGSRVYPSVSTIGRMVGRTRRAAQTATTELRRRQVLELARASGRGQSARYVFNAAALPAPDGQYPFSFDKTRFQQVKPPKRSGKDRFPQVPQQLTGSPLLTPEKWASHDPSVIREFSTRTRARAKTGTE